MVVEWVHYPGRSKGRRRWLDNQTNNPLTTLSINLGKFTLLQATNCPLHHSRHPCPTNARATPGDHGFITLLLQCRIQPQLAHIWKAAISLCTKLFSARHAFSPAFLPFFSVVPSSQTEVEFLAEFECIYKPILCRQVDAVFVLPVVAAVESITMPTLDVSELNVVLAILGAFILLYGFISIKIKQRWYLGEACTCLG